MLKIREDVKLEELEKWGFVDDEIYGRKVKIKRMMSGKEFNSEIVEIDLITRQLQIFIDDEYYVMYTKSSTLDFIYDLIKADLVVKVDE